MKLHTCTGPTCFTCRIKTISIRNRTAFQPHYNTSVGAHVDTELQFKDMLKRRAEENTLATGTYHEYEMRDPGDLKQTPYPQEDDILNKQGRELYAAR